MKKVILVLTAILTLCGTTMTLTSCSEKDDNFVAPTQEMTLDEWENALVGFHVDISKYLMNKDEINVWHLREDNTFTIYELRYNESGEFDIDTLSGSWEPFLDKEFQLTEDQSEKMKGFTTTYKDGNGNISDGASSADLLAFPLNDLDEKTQNDGLFLLNEYSFYELVTLNSGHPAITRVASTGSNHTEVLNNVGVALKDKVTSQDMASPESAEALLNNTLDKLSGKSDGDVYFNPNDSSFTQQNWRQQSNIYLYDGVGPESVGGYKFSIVPLPWSNNVTNTNLPFNFCDDVTPENGWQLVLNYCGSTINTNTNYFAVYNKYTGILRFFFYMPQDFDANGANDHAWKVILTDDLLQHVNMRYSLPMDRTITNKSAIGMNDADGSILVTPWVSSKSTDNYVTPQVGWWAFDIDFSLYRPNFHALNQQLRLQMCGWQKDVVTLSSTIDAQIKEKVPATNYSFNSLEGLTAVVSDAGGAIGGLYSNISGGQWGDAFKAGVSLAKWGYYFVSTVANQGPDSIFMVKQYIDGTISTQGLVSGSRAINGFSEPNIPMNMFDVTNTTLGQGIWNLKNTPVLYQLDASIKYDYTAYILTDPDRPSPFTLFKNENGFNFAYYCIFDPSSIEVELNPNVFPQDKVKSVDVQAFCGVRKDTKHDTSENYRTAFGLTSNNPIDLTDDVLEFSHTRSRPIDNNNPLYDYLFDASETFDLIYPSTIENYDSSNGFTYSLVGRGDEEYLMEPTMFARGKSAGGMQKWLPCYEVFVVVTVQLEGVDKPLVYTRTYLPNIELLNIANAKTVVNQLEDYVAKVKQSGKSKTDLLEMQLAHMKSVFAFLKPDYESSLEGVTFRSVKDGGGYVKYLFDGNLTTDWDASIKARENAIEWVFEFSASKPITPKTYTITTSHQWSSYQGSNPKYWILRGKDADGNWVDIDTRNADKNSDDALPKANSASKTYEIQNPGTYQDFQVVIINYDGSLSGFICFWVPDSCRCRIAEFKVED